jgi:hypothetical protein
VGKVGHGRARDHTEGPGARASRGPSPSQDGTWVGKLSAFSGALAHGRPRCWLDPPSWRRDHSDC